MKDLLAGSIDIVRRRLFEVVKPERQVRDQAGDAARSPASPSRSRADATSRRRSARSWRCIDAGELNEAALLGFAKAYKYEESIAALSAMSGVKIATLDRLISGDRYDPILIVGKTIGLEWATVRALILLRLGPNRMPSPADIESARIEFRAADAFDRGARRELLAGPSISVISHRERRRDPNHVPLCA